MESTESVSFGILVLILAIESRNPGSGFPYVQSVGKALSLHSVDRSVVSLADLLVTKTTMKFAVFAALFATASAFSVNKAALNQVRKAPRFLHPVGEIRWIVCTL